MSDQSKKVVNLFSDLRARNPADEDTIIQWLADYDHLLILAKAKGIESKENGVPRFPEMDARAQAFARVLYYATADQAVTATQGESSMTTNGTGLTN